MPFWPYGPQVVDTDSTGRSLADFLLDRIGEDEAVARRAWEQQAHADGPEPRTALQTHVARHSPSRVLVACEARRQIVQNSLDVDAEQAEELMALEPAGPSELPPEQTVGEVAFFERVLRYLAVQYADHPDYERQWRP